jgi:hypothetical protein
MHIFSNNDPYQEGDHSEAMQLGRLIGKNKVYEGQVDGSVPSGFGRIIYATETGVSAIVGVFKKGYPDGKVVMYENEPHAEVREGVVEEAVTSIADIKIQE